MATLEEKRRIAFAKALSMTKQHPNEGKVEEQNENKIESEETQKLPKENPLIKPSSFNMRPIYSRVDINCDKWLLTMDDASKLKLETPPTLADGIDIETEKELRFLGCELIQAGAILLRLPQTAAATGQILFQRFYFQKSFVNYMLEHTVMACLLLASKIEEAPRRPRDVFNVYCRLEQLHKIWQTGRKVTKEDTARMRPRAVDASYVNTKNHIIKAERRLMATLGFVVHVKHPHKLICSYIFILNQAHRLDLIQKAWSYMNDGLRTDMFVRYTPETIACACIFLAARTVEPQIPLPKTPSHWFDLLGASEKDVRDIASTLQQLYSRKKAPNLNKLMTVIDKIRTDREVAEKARQASLVAQKLVDAGKDIKEIKEDSKEKEKTKSRSRSRSRSRSPRRRSSRSPRRRRDSPDRRRRDDRTRKDGRREEKNRRRSRSRERFYKDKLKEQSRNRKKEVYQSLGKRYRKSSQSPGIKARKITIMEELRCLEFYSGIGGFHYALNALDIKVSILAAFDINTTVNAIYKHNFPDTPLCQNNIQGLTAAALDKYGANLWILSPPCQPFTKKGLQLDVEDRRSDSFLALLKIFSDMKCPPDYIFVENVMGFEQSEVLQQFGATIEAKGYSWKYYTINSLELGIPNSRPRCYVMAALDKHRIDFESINEALNQARQTSVPRSLGQYLDKTVNFETHPELYLSEEMLFKFGATMNLATVDSVKTTCFTKSYGRFKVGCGSYVCCEPHLVSDSDHFISERKDSCSDEKLGQVVRRFMPGEMAALLGFPETFNQPPHITDQQMYKSLGNSVNVTTVSFLLSKLLIR
ncbi:unnamed protein product [Auanema sp. JU1783]|nr:unnamed protein product [Auanema sp. JU1783]